MAMQSHLSRGDALFAMGEYHSAEDAYAHALALDPSIRRSKSFKVSVEKMHCSFDIFMVPITAL
jgi:tetratricopeptide (TPR) repeat protein